MPRPDLAVVVLLAFPATISAQGFGFRPWMQPELRMEAVAGPSAGVLVGAGVNVPAGLYVRVASSLTVGRETGAMSRDIGRLEVTSRFLTDPFREGRWNAYGGAGAGVAFRGGERGRGFMSLAAGLDFPGRTGWCPSLELGVGDGLRLTMGFRPARRTGR